MFKVRIPATSANLGPGFDTAGIALGLYNEVEVWLRGEISFEGSFKIDSIDNIDSRIAAGQIIPTDSTNLIYHTICWMASKFGKKLPSFYLKQNDSIPLARGLGSSAACIVAGLLIGNKLLGLSLSSEELLFLAVEFEGHPDNVAPAFLGNMVVGALCENKFDYVKIDISDKLEFISLIPDFPLSTSDARAVLPKAYTKEQAVFNCSRVALMVASIMSGNFDALSVALQDEIHQPYRKILIPGMEFLMKKALEFGCYGAYLSGAGPTIMVINRQGNDVINLFNDAAKTLKSYWLVKSLPVDKYGAQIID